MGKEVVTSMDEVKNNIVVKVEQYKELLEKAKLSEDYKDKWLRVFAEFDNAKKRWLKEKDSIIKYANEELIKELLPVLDDFEKAMENMKHDKNLKQGVEIIYKEIKRIMQKYGLKEVEKNDKFDPYLHEAVMYLESEEIPEGNIIEVIRKGYKLHDKLLRPALVKVSKGKTK
jgi:molecular chaperone GrpE